MGQILKFKPPDGTLKRLLQRSIELQGGKLTSANQTRAEVLPAEVVPMFRQRCRRNRI